MVGYPKEISNLRCRAFLQIVLEISQIKPEESGRVNASD
jgi:hypothetical protein